MRTVFLLALMLGTVPLAGAQGYYLCQHPDTGKKIVQDFPCKTGSEIRSYAPASAAEQKVREEASRQSKREFERQRPGTYAPEEYMTPEELAAYREKQQEREAARKKLEDELLLREAARRAAQAEQRASEAERLAREAQARATAAEEAAARSQQQQQPPLLLMPPPRTYSPPPPPFPQQPRTPLCERLNARGECVEEMPSGQSRLAPRPLLQDPPINPEKR